MKLSYRRIRNALLLISVFILILSFNLQVQAQLSDFTLSVKVKDASSSSNKDGSITIQVQSDQSGFVYLLFDKDPKDGGAAIAYSEQVFETEYTFSNLKTGRYYICVVDAEDNSRCQKVDILTE